MKFPTLLLLTALPALLPGEDRMTIGLTRTRATIEAIAVPGASSALPTVLIVGGLDGDGQVVTREVDRFKALRNRRFHLLAIPQANPNKVGLTFPPAGRAYRDNPESHYLWRWIGTQEPDLVLIAGEQDYGLAEALSANPVAGVGRIPARRVAATAGLLSSVPKRLPRSEARLETDRRRARTPRQVAEELAPYYGHEFKDAVYISAVALIGQLRLGHLAEVERAAAPFIDGSKDSLAKPTGSHLAGHLLFAELAERTPNKRYIERVRRAADLAMQESAQLHNEMSDAVFMSCPILAKAGKLTGERKYFEMTLQHLQFMQKLCLRPDGIYRHSPLDNAAWGRGNGFPVLGLALALSDVPASDPAFSRIRQSYQAHMKALARFQNGNGMWREVIDLPGSYSEFTATAMIATAMLRGIRSGWLETAEYQPRVDRAWKAISARIASDGRLIDVCESTGKQPSLDDYLNRLAILDRDPRGGAMALLLATEMSGLR